MKETRVLHPLEVDSNMHNLEGIHLSWKKIKIVVEEMKLGERHHI